MAVFTTTINSDADDAACRRSDATWANIVAAGGSFEDRSGLTTADASKALDTSGAPVYFHSIPMFRFDLSSLPSNAAISSALVKLYVDSISDPGNLSYRGGYYDFGGGTTVAGDWTLVETGEAISTFAASAITAGVVNDLVIADIAELIAGGYVGIRITPDDSVAPINDNYIRFATHEHGSGDPPALEITYELYPTLPIIDDFERSDSSNLGSLWTESGTSGLQIISGQIAEESSDGSAFLTDIEATDIEWYMEKGDASLNDRYIQWRAKNVARDGDPTTNWSGYQLRVSDDIELQRWSGSTLTVIANIGYTVAENEMIGVRHIGDNIKIFAKKSTEQTRVIGDTNGYTDSTYMDAGRLRIEFSSSLGRWEYVGGGSLNIEEKQSYYAFKRMTMGGR